MPLKIELKVGSDSFTLEGELGGPIDEQVVNLAKAWVAALPEHDPEDAEIADQITAVKDEIAGHSAALKAGASPKAPDQPAGSSKPAA